MLTRTLAAVLAALLAAGCQSLWNVGNRAGLAGAVSAVADIPEDQLDCRMIGTTRSGYCLARLTEAQAAALAKRLGLRDADWAPPEGCRTRPEFASARPVGLRGRPAALRPGELEELLLFVAPQAVCLQATHAYG